jgi:hypothetical protein
MTRKTFLLLSFLLSHVAVVPNFDRSGLAFAAVIVESTLTTASRNFRRGGGVADAASEVALVVVAALVASSSSSFIFSFRFFANARHARV